MNNSYIADQFSLLSKIMDIHGENSFKIKSYANAAFTIDKLPVQLAEMTTDKIFDIKGVGDTIGKKVVEIIETGQLAQLQEWINKTPVEVLEMLYIKGIGAKKVGVIWKEMGIETIGELLYACNENRLLLYKGFGEKTQENVKQAIVFYQKNKGNFLYAQLEGYINDLEKIIGNAFLQYKIAITGQVKQQQEVITAAAFVTTAPQIELHSFIEKMQFVLLQNEANKSTYKSPEGVNIVFYFTTAENFYATLVSTSSSDNFIAALQKNNAWKTLTNANNEAAVFEQLSLSFIPAYLRESENILQKKQIPVVIETSDIRGIIHSHSNWSDGKNTLEEMAKACIDKGLEYVVISDHSKTAIYAGGLYEDKIAAQHQQIDELNKKLAPFKIFKGIESDILSNGDLDYSPQVLASFDMVIASVHSVLNMTEEKAMIRLTKAIENQYTTVLGHPTGRLLLSRKGYPVDYKKLIDLCVQHHVAIEINANPNRLDIDWRWIEYALEKNATLSINPDAHSIQGIEDIRFGVLAAQKGGLTKTNNLSSLSRMELENYLAKAKLARQPK